MYEYVDDKHFLRRMRSLCGDIMQDLCHTLKEEYDIGASFYLVGNSLRIAAIIPLGCRPTGALNLSLPGRK